MKNPFVSQILKSLVKEFNAQLVVEPNYGFVGQIIFPNGKKSMFNNTNLNINRVGSYSIAKDKGYTSFFLRYFGYKVPNNQTFFNDKINQNVFKNRNIDDGFNFAKEIGFPVIIKPNDKGQWLLVCKVNTKKEYYNAAKKIFKISSVMLVEEFCLGKDYRILVVNDKVLTAYQRIPLSIIGDGKTKIQRLIEYKIAELNLSQRNIKIDLNDFRIKNKLKKNHLTPSSILKKDELIYLLDNANLSTGGSIIDCINNIAPEFKQIAVSIANDFGLNFCGVDIITDDISNFANTYKIIEINGSPGLAHYASMGTEQYKIVENIYRNILKYLSES